MTIKIDSSSVWYDLVTGSAAELVAAGIITMDMLPGQPGMGKTMATFMNGQRIGKGCQAATGNKKNETYRSIVCIGKDRYRVQVALPQADTDRRRAKEDAAREQARMAAWAELANADVPPYWTERVGLDFAQRVTRRQHLRLVHQGGAA